MELFNLLQSAVERAVERASRELRESWGGHVVFDVVARDGIYAAGEVQFEAPREPPDAFANAMRRELAGISVPAEPGALAFEARFAVSPSD